MNEAYMPFGERRLHERKSCSRMIQVNDFQSVFHGHLRDLAIGGAYIEPHQDNAFEIGQHLMLTIPFGLTKDRLTLKASVAWVKPLGMGVKFIRNKKIFMTL